MADEKISALTELTAGQVDPLADFIPIVDADGVFTGKVLPVNLGVYQAFEIIHTSDTALDKVANGGTALGSGVSVVIPTKGTIRITLLAGECDETAGLEVGQPSIGFNVNTTKVFIDFDLGGAGDEIFSVGISGTRDWTNLLNQSNVGTYSWDIVAHSIPTGAQTFTLYMADWSGNPITEGEITVTGTTTPIRFMVEIIPMV